MLLLLLLSLATPRSRRTAVPLLVRRRAVPLTARRLMTVHRASRNRAGHVWRYDRCIRRLHMLHWSCIPPLVVFVRRRPLWKPRRR